MNLSSHYDVTRVQKKRVFDQDEIIDILISPPMSIDINNIFQTPATLVVNIPRDEYIKKQIGTTISHKFNVNTVCREDMIIFSMGNE